MGFEPCFFTDQHNERDKAKRYIQKGKELKNFKEEKPVWYHSDKLFVLEQQKRMEPKLHATFKRCIKIK